MTACSRSECGVKGIWIESVLNAMLVIVRSDLVELGMLFAVNVLFSSFSKLILGQDLDADNVSLVLSANK